MYGLTGLALLALSSAVTAAPAVAAIPGNPGRPPRGYAFSVTGWEASCIPFTAGCGYTFTVTAPAVTEGVTPPFPEVNHQCTGIDNNYLVNCVPLSFNGIPDFQVLSRLTKNGDKGSRLFVRLELAQGFFSTQPAYYGRAQAPDFSLSGTSFTISPVREAPNMRQGQNNPITGLPI